MAIEEIMKRLQRELGVDYIIAGNTDPENCSYVAADIARTLIDEGQEVDLLEIQGRSDDLLHPKSFPKITWFNHIVCCSNGKAYDPLLGHAVEQSQYSEILLGEKRELHPRYNHEETLNLIEYYFN